MLRFYEEIDDRAKMTYTRIDLLKRGPSFTQPKQNTSTRGQAIARELCTAMIHVHRGRGHAHKHHAASCKPAIVACTLRSRIGAFDTRTQVAPESALATALQETTVDP